MPNIVQVKFISKGPRNSTLAVYLQSDGLAGDLNKQVIVDPVADYGLPATTRLTLLRVDYNLAGFDSIIEFDTGVPDPNWKWVLVEGANNPVDFQPYGGIKDDSGVNGTGKILLTTSGFNSTQDFGSILMQIRLD